MPRRYDDYEEDEWYAEGHHRRNLAPEPSRTRARSIGAQPAPNVYVYTSQRNDVDTHDGADSHTRIERDRIRESDRYGRDRRDSLKGIEDRLRDIDNDLRQSNSGDRRGASPYRSNVDMSLILERERQDRLALEERLREMDRQRDYERQRDDDKSRALDRKLARIEAEKAKEAEDRERYEREEELIKKKAELRRLKDKIEREEEETRLRSKEDDYKKQFELQRLKEEEKRKQAELHRKEEREKILAEKAREEMLAKEARKRIQMEMEAKDKADEEERKLMIAEFEAKKAAKAKADKDAADKAIADFEKAKASQKAKDDELRARFKAEDEAKKAKEKAEEEEWKLRIKMKEEAEKAKKKKEEEEVNEALHKKMAQFGFQENQIQAMIHPKKAEHLPVGSVPHRPAVGLITGGAHATPTYIKVHRDHLDVETLRFYGLEWEYDQADPRYIVILQEMDERETEILFEHTRKLRTSKTVLAIEDRGRDRHGHPEYAFVRRRAPSKSPSRKKETKRVSIFSLV